MRQKTVTKPTHTEFVYTSRDGHAMGLHIENLNKHFANGKHALQNIQLRVAHGEMVALIGASGSGKSTLLRIIAGLLEADAHSASRVVFNGKTIQTNGRLARDIRSTRAEVGFIFQQFNLVDRLSVLVNVMVGRLHRLPWWRALLRRFDVHDRSAALQALERVGIVECHGQRASTLSGGQQQRAAIARTLVQGARLVLADEPIASLDPESSRKVMEILSNIQREDGRTVIVSLHQVDMALRYCPRVVALHQGRIVYDGPSANLTPALLRELYGMAAHELLTPSSTLLDVPAAQSTPPAPFQTWLHAA